MRRQSGLRTKRMPPTRSPQKGLTASRRTLRRRGTDMSIVAMAMCGVVGVLVVTIKPIPDAGARTPAPGNWTRVAS